MSENCTHDCSTCGEACAERESESLLAQPHPGSHVKKIIGVVSGKGGVGKSLVSSMLAVLSARAGHKTAILDADITGPSIPIAFGVHDRPQSDGTGIIPVRTKEGISVMSLNLLLEHETDPVAWRGPIISGAVKQFWTDVIWGDVDYMFVDMPPGTGDVALTVFQSLPIDGLIIVSSPQELVGKIVAKAVKMAEMVDIPVLALVENMSYFKCPDCGSEHYIFGNSHIEKTAEEYGVKTTARLPIDPELAALCDSGLIESFKGDWLNNILEVIENI